MAFETKIFMTIMFFLAIAGFISTLMPAELRLISPFNFVLLGGSFVGIAGSCAIATGLVCAGALVVVGILNLFAMFVTNIGWVGAVIFVPLTMVIMYLAVRVARGGG